MPKQAPNFILDSSKFSAYPSEDKHYFSSGFLSPAASLDDLYEHPEKLSSVRLLYP